MARYTLLVTEGPDAGLRHVIVEPRVSVGRAREMSLVLSDPTVRPKHFLVSFEKGGWKATTYDRDATIVIDRRWIHPQTKKRGARIFAGGSQLLLFEGEIDLKLAQAVGRGLDAHTLTGREETITTVGVDEYEFRYDMNGAGTKRATSPARDRAEAGAGTRPSVASGAGLDVGGRALPIGVLQSAGSEMASMRILSPLPAAESSARHIDNPYALARTREKGDAGTPALQKITLTNSAISALPPTSRDLHVLFDRDGRFASEVRILATRLSELKHTFGYKSFVVTSPGRSDGKSVVAANLALAMSEDTDCKIAFVDANFRHPRGAELFNLDPTRGVLTALDGTRALAECVARVVDRNLIVLNTGGSHEHPALVLSNPKFKTLLGELAAAVDFMIVDAPAALPHADVSLLAPHVDAMLVVVAKGRTRRNTLEEAIRTIGRTRVVGTIFVETT